MHANIINYYCYCNHYFTVCELRVISLIFLSIQLTISGNSEVRAVVFPNKFKFLIIRIFPYFQCIHINNSSPTSIIFVFGFIIFLLQFLLWRDKHRNTGFVTRGCLLQGGRRTFFLKLSVSKSLPHNSNVSNKPCVWPIYEKGVFSTKPVISLLESACFFGRTTRCLCLRWSLWSKKNQVT